jgi:hypothetical protein
MTANLNPDTWTYSGKSTFAVSVPPKISIMRYIRSYNRNATPIKWPYKDASNRIEIALGLNETVH